MRRKGLILALALGLALFLVSGALAQIRPLDQPLGKLGPISTTHGFPEWIEDNSLSPIRLDLPSPPYGDGVNAPTLIFDPVIAGNAQSEASGFGGEAFFFLANSVMNLPNGGQAVLDLGIEAAYGAGDPQDGDQFLFSRVRVRFDVPAAGTYTVTHPWGVETLTVTQADVGQRFSHVIHFGGFAPLCPEQLSCFAEGISESAGFERILVSPKEWRFLIPTDKVTIAGQEGYILGDGVTETTVSNGVNGVNSFTITGPPNAFGTTNTVNTNLFTVSGHIYGQPIPDPTVTPPPPPPEPTADIVTITRARLRGAQVEIRATSSSGLPMTAELFVGGVGGTLVGSGNLGNNGRGNVSFTGGTPDTVRVHSTSTNPAVLGGAAIAPVTN
jgi:hypothetical protein